MTVKKLTINWITTSPSDRSVLDLLDHWKWGSYRSSVPILNILTHDVGLILKLYILSNVDWLWGRSLKVLANYSDFTLADINWKMC